MQKVICRAFSLIKNEDDIYIYLMYLNHKCEIFNQMTETKMANHETVLAQYDVAK